MKLAAYKKYFIIITYTMLLGFILLHIQNILNFVLSVLNVLTPVWIGIGLAFTLNVPMSIIEKDVFGNSSSKLTRLLSLIISILFVLLIFIVLFVWIIPDFVDSASYLVGQIPNMMSDLNNFLQKAFQNTELSEYLKDFSGTSEVTNIVSNVFKALINNFSSVLTNFVTFIVDLVTGIIIAVYFLFEKERILSGIKNIMNKLFDKKIVKKIYEVFSLANKSFHDFITYQCLECLILGILMFISFVIFKFPYALTIAFLTTVTAVVPIFGATIACVIGAILIGTVSINQAVLFLIVFQVIQQIENNVIYPKVVGMHVGLPPVVTIIAILIGGKLAGFLGMLICIPLTSVIYSLFKMNFEKQNKKAKN